MTKESVLHLCINLPWATERRAAVELQARHLGVDIVFIAAVAGRDLPPDVPEYDKHKRIRTCAYDLTSNEIACTLSHKKALRAFLDSAAEYAVIMEDDALLSEHYKEGLHEIIDHLRGWEMVKLYTDDGGKLYSIGDEWSEGSYVQAVFPRKIMWVSVAWLYTRSGAQKLLSELNTFCLATDAQIGSIVLQRGIPVIGVSPSLIRTSDPENVNSTISTADAPRTPHARRTFLQYLRYRIGVIRTACAKKRMIRLMKQRFQRV